MKILKQKTNIIYLFFLISIHGFAQETNNEIDLKEVRETILESGNYMFPKSCLLYTSPSPRDVEESRMPSSA